MKILILTTYYPPDTAIAAVRPYMFAKYLSQLGHSVTVLRSGEINKRCDGFFEPLPGVRVISYLGENSPAERYQRGEWDGVPFEQESRVAFLPKWIRTPAVNFYHFCTRERDVAHRLERRLDCYEKQKAALDALKDHGFDIVFSTVGEFENAFAGQYAAKLFSCPLIQDFRDPVATDALRSKKAYAYLKKVQNDAIQKADACTAVSNGVLQGICADVSAKKTLVVYNGYEPSDTEAESATPKEGTLSFCYTGQIYVGQQDFSPLLRAIAHLHASGKISLDKIRIHFAGKNYDHLYQLAERYGVADVLVDHGYVSRKEAAKIQAESDVYVVLSWNTKSKQGVLTGKFYEGIRAKKLVLSMVAGDAPHSELDLINKKYNYGFCYENCRENEQFTALCDYLEALYREKISTGKLTYTPDPALETDFRYDMLSRKLEALCLQLLEEK